MTFTKPGQELRAAPGLDKCGDHDDEEEEKVNFKAKGKEDQGKEDKDKAERYIIRFAMNICMLCAGCGGQKAN